MAEKDIPGGGNRRIKDSMFVDLFGKDINAKENFLSLYNALHGTDLRLEDTKLEPEMIDGAVYMSYANDVAMMVNGQVVVLIEHQSTINQNMPLRLLDYVTRIYERIIPARKKYYRSRIQIPMPEFYVLYNGTDDFPAEEEMRLSDAYIRPEGREPDDVTLELVVRVYNINVGKGDALLEKCVALRQYSQFIALLREAHRTGKMDPLSWAVREAVRKGILPEYLERKSTEVFNMFLMEYDYKDDIASQREESLEEGIRIGEKRGLEEGLKKGRLTGLEEGLEKGRLESMRLMMQKLNMPLPQVMETLNIPPEKRGKYASLLS